MRVAYLANSFPEPVEPYVWEEIHELRRRGATVVSCAMRKPSSPARAEAIPEEVLFGFPLRLGHSLKACWLFLYKFASIRHFCWRAIAGKEPCSRKLRALAHTWLGVYLASLLQSKNIRHIHVHHGYYASWVGMVAARILNIDFSFTLHGSDLLIHPQFLDIKLQNCKFCITVSEFNKRHILDHYGIDAHKVVVQRLGIDLAKWPPTPMATGSSPFCIFTVGRLHPVKNHRFLLLACRALKDSGVQFRCIIAGEGAERSALERMIAELRIAQEVRLVGHVARERLPQFYAAADVVVLTSHSEGIPVTLMEAMAMERLVIAPRITGIPELVIHDQTGFLYQPNSQANFLDQVGRATEGGSEIEQIRRAARRHVEQNFNGSANLANFATHFLTYVDRPARRIHPSFSEQSHEDPLLQQI